MLLYNYSEQKWLKVTDEFYLSSDIITFKGRFYAINTKGKLIVIDPMTFEGKEIIKSHSEEQQCQRSNLYHYLVESSTHVGGYVIPGY